MLRGTFAHIRCGISLPPARKAVGLCIFRRRKNVNLRGRRKVSEAGVPLMVIAGKEYGSGSRAIGPPKERAFSACAAVIAESYERIHRSNLTAWA